MTGAITWREAGPSDAGVIRELTRRAYAKWVPMLSREPLPMGVDYEIAVRKHRFDLLYVDGALAGLIETLCQGERLLVVNVAVAPESQRRGLGSQLLAHAEGVARSAGCGRIWLYTNQRFTENVALYLRLGYAVDLEEDLGGGTVRVDMSKAVASDAVVQL